MAYQALQDRRGSTAATCPAPLTAIEAAQSQQGLPTTQAEALRELDALIAFDRKSEAKNSWTPAASLAGHALSRAQLSGDYRDYATADAALVRAFAAAPTGLGPHLARATFNMSVHRLGRVAPDLEAVARYRLPDPGEKVTALAVGGDLLFYRGDYAGALARYERAHAAGGGIGTAIRLATWWSRMGDPGKAATYLDEAACAIGGPQQQLHAFVEMQRGTLTMAAGKWDEAQAIFHRADAIFPGYWAIELPLASVTALKGERDKALLMFLTIARRDRIPEAYDSIAGLLRERGDFERSQRAAAVAERLWRARLELFPEAAYGHAFTHHLAFGDRRFALELARRNYIARPYAGSAIDLATALLANGRAAEAIQILSPALASGWASADLQIVASEAYALAGQVDDAETARTRALAINPHSFDRNSALAWVEH